jgi:hypothetical protein
VEEDYFGIKRKKKKGKMKKWMKLRSAIQGGCDDSQHRKIN